MWTCVPDRTGHRVFDPEWLRSSFRRCLWDGRPRLPGSEFCSEKCRIAHEEWMAERASRSLPEGVVEFPDTRPARPGPALVPRVFRRRRRRRQ